MGDPAPRQATEAVHSSGLAALREELEDERRRSRSLEDQARLRDDSVAMVAHDLRTPISVIAGYAEILMRGDLSPDVTERSVAAIRDNAVRLGQLVDEILDVARHRGGSMGLNPQALDLVALARKAAASVAGPDERERVRILAPSPVERAWADEERTWQVLSNLISNALRHTAGSRAEVRFAHSGMHVAVEVVDAGPGISEEELGKLFTRYSRLAGSDQGSTASGMGLGLWICRQLVEMQGGRVWARSALGEGSIFGFALPMASSSGGAPAAVER